MRIIAKTERKYHDDFYYRASYISARRSSATQFGCYSCIGPSTARYPLLLGLLYALQSAFTYIRHVAMTDMVVRSMIYAQFNANCLKYTISTLFIKCLGRIEAHFLALCIKVLGYMSSYQYA